MKIIKTTPRQSVYVIDEVCRKIKPGTKVALLVSGGSNIKLAEEVNHTNSIENFSDSGDLNVSLIDERFGPVGHKDSNWKALLDAGFDTDLNHGYPLLKDGMSIGETTTYFEGLLKAWVEENRKIIAIFGMGEDGHTAGILPRSPAVTARSWTAHYQGPDYKRVTITPAFFPYIDTAFLVANGENKRQQLEKLQTDASIVEQPAQALKLCKELIVLNDQIGEPYDK